MDDQLRQAIVDAYLELPADIRRTPAVSSELEAFEQEFGPIPEEFRWYLARCGGGVCGPEWIDGIAELAATHRKFALEFGGDRGWRMRGVFLIGWDGSGDPYGIEIATNRVLVESHLTGQIHEMASSFSDLLTRGYLHR
jgi:hypothetical protein